jgi:hypothetical protein
VQSAASIATSKSGGEPLKTFLKLKKKFSEIKSFINLKNKFCGHHFRITIARFFSSGTRADAISKRLILSTVQ